MNKNFHTVLLAGVIIVVLAVLVMVGGPAIQASTTKKASSTIGFVDVMAVFEAHPDKAKAEKTLSDEVVAMQAQMEKEVKNQTQEQRKVTLEKYQEKLAKREQELTNQIIVKIDESIREVADEMGIQVVLEKKNVIYGGQDITKEVKERIETQAKK